MSETVGKIASQLMQKEPESRDPIELQREMTSEYIANLIECVNRYKKTFVHDFYVVVITKNEKLLPNVFRNQFFARLTCPTPDYDQSVYKYYCNKEQLQYVWTIPSQDACIHLLKNELLVDKSESELLNFVKQFSEGKLFKMAKKLNGEKLDSSEIELGRRVYGR